MHAVLAKGRAQARRARARVPLKLGLAWRDRLGDLSEARAGPALHFRQVARPAWGGAGGRTHAATRTFQALRRAVNQEGEELRQALLLAEAELVPGGRLVTLTFHSGEDGEVKRFLARGVREGRWQLWNKRPLEPERAEVRRNPRARSARLRAAIRKNGVHSAPSAEEPS